MTDRTKEELEQENKNLRILLEEAYKNVEVLTKAITEMVKK